MTIYSDLKYYDKFRNPVVENITVKRNILDFPVFLRQRTGVWVRSNLLRAYSVAWADVPANYLRAVPMLIPQRARLSGFGIRVYAAGGAGAQGRVGIYTDDGNFYPKSLVPGTELVIDMSTAGDKFSAIDVVLDRGIYWMAEVHNDGTVDLIRMYTDFYLINYGENASIWRVAYTYGALPSTFPSGATATDEGIEFRYRIAEYLD
jgi:hypothetical protein